MFAVFQTQGFREYMEDTVDVEEGFYKDYDFYAIFDGHGGDQVSKYLQMVFRKVLVQYMQHTEDVGVALMQSFNHITNNIKDESFAYQTGSTAIVMVKNSKQVWVANAGDCRAILKYFDKVQYQGRQISVDHKPNLPSETKRIEANNGVVVQDPFGTWRVNGNLAISRSFGDRYLYPWVISEPDIYSFNITEDMRAVILGSDGVWDTMSNDGVVSLANEVIKSNMSFNPPQVLQKITEAISVKAQQNGSSDNISVLFIII